MICGTFQQTGLDQATADLIYESYNATTPAPLGVNKTQAADGTWTVTAVYPPCPSNVSHSMLTLSSLSPGQQSVATQIASAFAKASYGTPQQATAVANAIAESSLNPMAVSTPPEHSVGLFQLNMTNGLGKGYTQEQLQDPATNIAIIVAECQKYPMFGAATDIVGANQVFVAQIERPSDIPGDTAQRLAIAQTLVT